ncbi:hypothetical protein EMEDMD4_980037 [Sinorhizobium medicae]|uniref:Uncharacterized protein n=1 Tax=Sinorhizobium medicae TaxID=110321 RepID=A0A508X8J4_9HYPH|nr:hypothetical protein EMEDMD4_980037 [Sinorhizobium medicae]
MMLRKMRPLALITVNTDVCGETSYGRLEFEKLGKRPKRPETMEMDASEGSFRTSTEAGRSGPACLSST